jgi:hypothetical protein
MDNKIPTLKFNAFCSILWSLDPKTGKPIQRDIGDLKINLDAHRSELDTLGLDVVHSEADNIAYGKVLYVREGLKPWFASKHCWSGEVSRGSSPTPAPCANEERKLHGSNIAPR